MVCSFIVPAYNAESTITRCINSIEKYQYTFQYEVVIVDDGSTDNTGSIIQKLAKDNQHIAYYKKSNGGPSTARNYGISVAKGEYIVFVDADDWIDAEIYQFMISAHIDADIIIHGCVYDYMKTKCLSYLNIDTQIISDKTLLSKSILALDKKGLLSSPCMAIFKLDIILSHKVLFPEDLNYGEDACFTYDYLLYCDRIYYVNQTPYHYNKINEKSITKNYIRDRYPLCNVKFAHRLKLYINLGFTREFIEQYAHALTIEIINCVKNACLVGSPLNFHERLSLFDEISEDNGVTNYFAKFDNGFKYDLFKNAICNKNKLLCVALIMMYSLRNRL